MGTLIKNGTVVNATGSQRADVLIEGEKIAQVAASIPEANHKIVDATNLLVMPGGIDVHTHLDMPFGGTTSRMTTDRHAGRSRRRHNHRHRLRAAEPSSTLPDALKTWRRNPKQSLCRLIALHMAVTDLHGKNGEGTLDEMEEMVKFGISSFKLFMAYPNVLMVNDAHMFSVMQKAAEAQRARAASMPRTAAPSTLSSRRRSPKAKPRPTSTHSRAPEGRSRGSAPRRRHSRNGRRRRLHRAPLLRGRSGN